MSKYDFALDMDSLNSNSTILKNILPNTSVLEIGCAHGRMTKYLKEELKCQVTIAEINTEAGNIASQWADMSYVGLLGDVQNTNFFNMPNKFDYIIFADVLEHLPYPDHVLSRCKSSLRGSVWISIPNISHNSVLIDLLNDRFKYRETGLLDNTHLRFFTEESLEELVYNAGFQIKTKHNLKNVVENTEFDNSYDDVPEDVSSFLKQRKNGDTYQFVWELYV